MLPSSSPPGPELSPASSTDGDADALGAGEMGDADALGAGEMGDADALGAAEMCDAPAVGDALTTGVSDGSDAGLAEAEPMRAGPGVSVSFVRASAPPVANAMMLRTAMTMIILRDMSAPFRWVVRGSLSRTRHARDQGVSAESKGG
jgi:hypothetical protein